MRDMVLFLFEDCNLYRMNKSFVVRV